MRRTSEESDPVHLKILILTQYFPPEVGAAQQRLAHHASFLSGQGHSVSVITTMPSYPLGRTFSPYRGRLWAKEKMTDVEVFRTPTFALGSRPRLVHRLLNYLGFLTTALLPFMLAAWRSDVILVESPPITMFIPALIVSRRRPVVLSISDLWPQSAVELGALTNPRVIAIAEKLEVTTYERANAIIALTEGIAWGVRGLTRDTNKIHVIPNGVDPALYPTVPEKPKERRPFRLTYAGTVGLAQGLETVVDAAALLKDDDVVITILGGGPARVVLEKQSRELGLTNVVFRDPVPKLEAINELRHSDATLVSLKDTPILRGAVPSKLYEALAVGLPVVLVGAGASAQLVSSLQCGAVVSPGDAQGLAAAVRALKREAGSEVIGMRGRQFVLEEHDIDALSRRVEHILFAVTRQRSRS